jgi:hypothetical protein
MAGYTFSFWSSPLLPLVFFYFDNKYLLFPASPCFAGAQGKKKKKSESKESYLN